MFQTSVYFLHKNCYQASLFENLLGGSTPPPPPPPPPAQRGGGVHTRTIVFEQPIILSENWKKFDKLQLPYSSIFFDETLHTFFTY